MRVLHGLPRLMVVFFRPRALKKRKRSQVFLGDVELANENVTCVLANYAPAVEQFDDTLKDWSQRRNVDKTERLLVVPKCS